jgi:hypothetical protein
MMPMFRKLAKGMLSAILIPLFLGAGLLIDADHYNARQNGDGNYRISRH